MLASELRLHDVSTVILERDAEPTPLIRSLGLHARSLEILDQRGLLDRFLAAGTSYPVTGSFAGLTPSRPVTLDSAHAYTLGL
ncbi:MAG: FAD-dependent monooxygenase, partial [Leifsonia sp.]